MLRKIATYLPLIFLYLVEKASKKASKRISKYIFGSCPQKKTNRNNNQTNAGTSRVFIIFNHMPFMRGYTGAHIKVLGNIAKFYLDKDIQVVFLGLNHPLKSIYKNRNLIIKKPFLVGQDRKIELLQRHLWEIAGIIPNQCSINIVPSRKGFISFKNYLEIIYAIVDKYKINRQDIAIAVGGKFGSEISHNLVANYFATRVYLMMNKDNRLDDELRAIYTYVLGDLSNNRYENFSYVRGGGFVKKFYWERISSILRNEEVELLIRMKESRLSAFLITAFRDIDKSISGDFLRILKNHCDSNPMCGIVLIGASREKISRAFGLRDGLLEKTFSIEFASNLFSLFKQVGSEYDVIYVFPREGGGAQGTLTAAMAGLPLTLFKENDAEHILPAEYFVDSVDLYVKRLERLTSNIEYRQSQIASAKMTIEEHNHAVGIFWNSLIKHG